MEPERDRGHSAGNSWPSQVLAAAMLRVLGFPFPGWPLRKAPEKPGLPDPYLGGLAWPLEHLCL